MLTQKTHQVVVLPPNLSEIYPPSARMTPDGRVKNMVMKAAERRLRPYCAT